METTADQELINAANENGSNDLNNTKAVFKLLEVKNTPKKKGKGGADPNSAEKVEKKEKEPVDTQKNGTDKVDKKKKEVDDKELQKMIQ